MILQNKRGSFLLEALLAVLILSVGLVGLIRGLLSSLHAAREAEFYSAAISAADSALFDVVRLNGQKTNPSVALDTKSENIKAQIDISPSKNLQIPADLQEAQVRVKWPGPVKQKELNAVTLVLGPPDEKK